MSQQVKLEKQRLTEHSPMGRFRRFTVMKATRPALMAPIMRERPMLSGGVSPTAAKKLSSSAQNSSMPFARPTVMGASSCGGRSISGSPWASMPFRTKPRRDQKRSRRSSPQLSSQTCAVFAAPVEQRPGAVRAGAAAALFGVDAELEYELLSVLRGVHHRQRKADLLPAAAEKQIPRRVEAPPAQVFDVVFILVRAVVTALLAGEDVAPEVFPQLQPETLTVLAAEALIHLYVSVHGRSLQFRRSLLL